MNLLKLQVALSAAWDQNPSSAVGGQGQGPRHLPRGAPGPRGAGGLAEATRPVGSARSAFLLHKRWEDTPQLELPRL